MMPTRYPEVFTVSRLNQESRFLLEKSLGSIWLEGEVSSLSIPSSGHWYFLLKDPLAQVRCAMFRSQNNRLLFRPKEGDQVLVKATVSLYESRGEYQLIVEQMSLQGDGLLKRAFEELKNRLFQEGLFAVERKKPLPTEPQRLGVITSPSGAVIHDILTVLKRRAPSLPIILYPTSVQGATAAAEIVQAIQMANRRQECDVLILARGGGSLEDLAPFNDEKVARAIHASRIPLVSAVGHESDVSISDFVADLSAPTPSAAAEIVSQFYPTRLQKLADLKKRLERSILQDLNVRSQQVFFLRKRLRDPLYQLREIYQKKDALEERLKKNMLSILSEKAQQLGLAVQGLHAYSPLRTLQRGYAIVKKEEIAVTHLHQVKLNDSLSIDLQDGQLECIVTRLSAPAEPL